MVGPWPLKKGVDMLKTPQNWIDSSVPSAPRVYLKTLKPRLREVTPIVKAPHSAPVLILSRFTLCGRTIHSIQCSTVSQIVCSPIQPSSHPAIETSHEFLKDGWLQAVKATLHHCAVSATTFIAFPLRLHCFFA